jgi:hypothetical protein
MRVRSACMGVQRFSMAVGIRQSLSTITQRMAGKRRIMLWKDTMQSLWNGQKIFHQKKRLLLLWSCWGPPSKNPHVLMLGAEERTASNGLVQQNLVSGLLPTWKKFHLYPDLWNVMSCKRIIAELEYLIFIAIKGAQDERWAFKV